MIPNADTIRSSPLAVAFIAVSLAVIFIASQFPDDGELGSGFFPIAISVGILVFAALDIVLADDAELELSYDDLKVVGVVFVGLTAYVGLMPVTGFLVGTMAFLAVILHYSGVGSKVTIASVAVLLPVALYYVFSQLFLVRMPEGIIPFSRLLPRLPLGVL